MDFNYRYVGFCDIMFLKDVLSNVDDSLWFQNTYRQDTYDEHKHTEFIELIWDNNSVKNNTKGKISPNYYNFNIDRFFSEIKPFYEKIYGEGDFMRAVLIKLKKQCKIKEHMDTGKSLIQSYRTHIPIVTHENVVFSVDNEKKYMKEGEIWEIANQKMHYVENNSEIDRIHLMVDYINHHKKTLI